MLRRSTHYDCPKCGFNLSCYGQTSCDRCGHWFSNKNNWVIISETGKTFEITTSKPGGNDQNALLISSKL